MKHTSLLSLLLAGTMALSPLQVLAAQKSLTIPAHTNVPIILKYPLSGNTLRSGDPISVTVNEDVYIEDVLVFRKGQDGVLFIEKSKHNGTFGRAGSIDIRSGSLKDTFGNDHAVQITKYVKADGKPSAVILPIVSLLVLWPLAFTAFRRGEEAVIPAGTLLFGLTTAPKVFSFNETAAVRKTEGSTSEETASRTPISVQTEKADKTDEALQTEEKKADSVPAYLQKYTDTPAEEQTKGEREALRQLETLGRLRKQGVITEAEFRAKKKQLLGL